MKKVTSFPTIGVYIGSEKILGTKFGLDAVLRLVPTMHKQSTLVSLSKIVWSLETWAARNNDLQKILADFLFPDKQSIIKPLLSDGVGTLFMQPQIHTLMKLLLVDGIDDVNDLNFKDGEKEKTRLALLGITDAIDRQFRYINRELDQEDLLKNVVHAISLASFFINNPRIGLSLARATHLYINTHRTSSGAKTVNYLDIEEIFQQATGFNLTEYLALGIGILVHYLPNWTRQTIFGDGSFIYLTPKELFSNSKIQLEKITKIIDAVSGSTEFFKAEFKGQSKRELSYDFFAFRAFPLLKLRENLYIPISVLFLLDRMTMGVYWILFDYLKRKSSVEHAKFMRYHGEIFQKYTEDILRQILKRDQVIKLLIDEEYRVKKNTLRTPDLVVVGHDSIILIEISAARLQAKRTVALGKAEAFNEDFEKVVLHNARSLDTYVKNMIQGKGLLDNPMIQGKTIYPLIVTIDGFVPHPIMNVYIDRVIKEKSLLQGDQIKPLSIVAVDEIEELEGYSDHGLIEIMKLWLLEGLTRHSLSSLIRRANPKGGLKSDWLKKIQEQIFNEATKIFFDKELEDIEGS